MKRKLALVLVLACSSAAPAVAGEAETFAALRMLAQLYPVIPATGSGCEGELPGLRRPTLGDLVASRLSVFETGANRIAGLCEANGACTVTMNHEDGEDVSSARFMFRVSGRRAVRSSLRCAFTP